MLTWLTIAIRNLLRNGRRSLFTILAIGLGFAAVNVFGGFTTYIFSGLRDSNIYTHANGHLTIFKKGFLSEGRLEPEKYLITEDEHRRILRITQTFPQIKIVTPQLFISGLFSNGEVSTVFVAIGRIPSTLYDIQGQARGFLGRLKIYNGDALSDDMPHGIAVASGLANRLGLEIGTDAIAMAPTVSGQINALDATLVQTFDTAETLNDQLMIVPLEFAQSLYDTTSMDRITVLLRDTGDTAAIHNALALALDEADLEMEVSTWWEQSPFYMKVKDMFSVIFVFIFIIVLLIAVMSVINTVSMAVLERIRELATLRVLGLKRFGIMRLIALESLMLACFGSMLGFILTLLAQSGVDHFRPTWVPPHLTGAVPLEIRPSGEYMLLSLFLLVLMSLLAAFFPARRAARMNIVKGLGHV